MMGGRIGLALEMLQDRIAAHARHHHVQNDQVGALLVDQVLALLAIAGLQNLVPLALKDGPNAVR